MALSPAQIMFGGCEVLVVLLAGYALYEWALVVLKKFGTTWSEKKAQLAFGVPATFVSFLPCIVLSVAVNLQPYGDQYIVKTEDVALVYAFMVALGTGMLIMLLAFVLLAVQMASLKRQKK